MPPGEAPTLLASAPVTPDTKLSLCMTDAVGAGPDLEEHIDLQKSASRNRKAAVGWKRPKKERIKRMAHPTKP